MPNWKAGKAGKKKKREKKEELPAVALVTKTLQLFFFALLPEKVRSERGGGSAELRFLPHSPDFLEASLAFGTASLATAPRGR